MKNSGELGGLMCNSLHGGGTYGYLLELHVPFRLQVALHFVHVQSQYFV